MVGKKKLIEIVNGWQGKKVAVVGDVMLDVSSFGKSERINPDNPAVPLIRITRDDIYVPGGAGNVAANLASLGLNVDIFGLIGKDDYRSEFDSSKLKQEMEARDINFYYWYEGSTLTKRRSFEETQNQGLLRQDAGEEEKLEPVSRKSSDGIFHSLTEKGEYDGIFLSDYDKRIFRGKQEENLARRIISWAKDKEIPVFVDPKPDNYSHFRYATVITPNESEAREMVGNPEISSENLVKRIMSGVTAVNKTFENVVVTRGKEGMMAYDGEKVYNVPTEAKEIVDITGAGDTVLSSWGASYISGAQAYECCVLANKSAGIACRHRGTYAVPVSELLKAIERD